MKICIISHNAYGALIGKNQGHIGGVERQTALLSRWLARQGHHVSVITWDEGGDKIEKNDGIRIIKLCREDEGITNLRFFFPRWSSLIKALKLADAEVYYHNCAEYFTGQIALWCKIYHRAFIYSVASDIDCQLESMANWSLRDKYLFQFGLRHANEIICQTYNQKMLLMNNFELNASVIPMPGTPPESESDSHHQFSQQKIIWVGRVQTEKRIEWYIDIAMSLPQFLFEVIGPTDQAEDHIVRLLPQAKKLANLKFLGKINHEKMANVYKNASLLCNTSIYEGFPNTYLEAWSYGLPLVCTIDPDNIVQENTLGSSSTEKKQLIIDIEELLTDEVRWKICAENSKEYYQKHHNLEKVQALFEAKFVCYSGVNDTNSVT